MPQNETRQVAQQDLGRLVVELLALGGIRLVARLRQDRVEIGVAVLAVVLAAVAGREREDVAVRVRAPTPEGEVGLEVALAAGREHRDVFLRLDRHRDPPPRRAWPGSPAPLP